jgi:hypothetical protein
MLTVIIVCKACVASRVILIWCAVLILAILLELLELIGVGSTDELPVHVEDLALRVHKELAVVTFNLNSSHDHVVLHVDAHLLSLGICVCLSLVLYIWLAGWDFIVILRVVTVRIGIHLSKLLFVVLVVTIRIRILELLLLI